MKKRHGSAEQSAKYAAEMVCAQGGAVPDGSKKDPHAGCEAPKSELGHGSAPSAGVGGKEIPGGGGSSASPGTGY